MPSNAARGATDLPQQVTPLPTLLAEGRFIGFERDRSARFFECWALQHLPPERIVFRVDIFQSVLHFGIARTAQRGRSYRDRRTRHADRLTRSHSRIAHAA